jgi:A/G-specific adenine glycosylase
MLQQTQVTTVIPFYERFLQSFPTLAQLAASDEQHVLRHWEGLGYYRRARQLHRAARMVVEQHAGQFPQKFEQVLDLPGIGRYTAGAILSFAFDQRLPILEANTLRLYSRLSAFRGDPRSTAGQRWLWKCAQDWLPPQNAGQFNQAMMELGSTVCLPRDPTCDECPLNQLCPTRALRLQAVIPQAPRRAASTSVDEAFVAIRRRERVLLLKRDQSSRWAGMWDFPRFNLSGAPTADDIGPLVANKLRLSITDPQLMATLKHGVTRFRITLYCFTAQMAAGRSRPLLPSAAVLRQTGHTAARWCTDRDLRDLPLSVTARKFAGLLARETTTLAPQ